MERELFIHQVRMVEIEGSTNVPTVLLYRPDGRVLIGSAAQAGDAGGRGLIEEFKLALGNIPPGSLAQKIFTTSTNQSKSAFDLTVDFFGNMLEQLQRWLV
jgi:hypothetical protein